MAGFRVLLKDFDYIKMLLYKTNRFHVAVRLFSNRSQKTSIVVRTSVAHSAIASFATFLFLPHFDVICYLSPDARQHGIYLLNSHWNNCYSIIVVNIIVILV